MPLVFGLLAWWLWLPICLGAVWAFNHLGPNGYKWTQTYDIWLYNSILNGVFPWLFLLIGALGTLVGGLFYLSDDFGESKQPAFVAVAAGLVLTIAGTYFTSTGLWDNDKDYGRYYAYSAAVYVNDPDNVPDSLNLLVDGAASSDNCALLGAHDVYGCVRQGSLPAEGWDARVSSFTGAQIAMQRKVGEVQRSSLAMDTVTYLNERDNRPAMWTGIFDGSGKEQSMVGVVEWEGKGEAHLCKFEGDYALRRAFDGERGNSLPNYLAEQFPDYRYSMTDVWGYCDGDEPVVVLPVTEPILWMDRTVDTAAGIIVIRGSGGGEPKLEHFASVEPGTYPGPVYPMSLVAKQREQAMWIAGRKNEDRFGFGYEPTASEVQKGNVSEYLLREKATGRLVFVTPSTLRNSSSEVFVTYEVAYADEVHAGRLNELSIYVLDEGDPHRINIDTLASTANDWMARNAGMFRANHGELIEFTPVNGEVWRVFGEMNNQVVYQLDISLNERIAPKLVSLSTDYASANAEVPPVGAPAPVPGAPSASGNCGNPSVLTVEELRQCVNTALDELARRANTPAPPK